MSYSLLGQDLHEAADKAKKWFADHYGAKSFKREEALFDLPLRPTWQATLQGGYFLCINVQPSPFSQTLHEFVNQSAQRTLPIRLWVAVGPSGSKDSFTSELKQARNSGIGVIQIAEKGDPHVFHRAMTLSMFGLARTNMQDVVKSRREVFQNAEDTFLEGAPEQGCQAISQEIEHVSRQFAQTTYDKGWWKQAQGQKTLGATFFTKKPWAAILEEMERRANVAAITAKSPSFNKQLVVRTRAITDWRNEVSHKPNGLAQLKKRDARLRTMFEATRDLLIDWYDAAKPLGLVK